MNQFSHDRISKKAKIGLAGEQNRHTHRNKATTAHIRTYATVYSLVFY